MSPQPDDDPLTLALMPPPDETWEQRQVREAAEAEAKRVSDEIDEQIKRDRENERRRKRPVKLLLLGEPLHAVTSSTPMLIYCFQVRVKVERLQH